MLTPTIPVTLPTWTLKLRYTKFAIFPFYNYAIIYIIPSKISTHPYNSTIYNQKHILIFLGSSLPPPASFFTYNPIRSFTRLHYNLSINISASSTSSQNDSKNHQICKPSFVTRIQFTSCVNFTPTVIILIK